MLWRQQVCEFRFKMSIDSFIGEWAIAGGWWMASFKRLELHSTLKLSGLIRSVSSRIDRNFAVWARSVVTSKVALPERNFKLLRIQLRVDSAAHRNWLTPSQTFNSINCSSHIHRCWSAVWNTTFAFGRKVHVCRHVENFCSCFSRFYLIFLTEIIDLDRF